MTLEIHGNPTKNPQRRTASSWSPGGQGIIYVLIYRNQPTKKPCCHQSHKKTSKLSVFLRSHQKKGTPTNSGVLKLTFPRHQGTHQGTHPPPGGRSHPASTRTSCSATARAGGHGACHHCGFCALAKKLFLLNENPNLGLMTFIGFFWCRYCIYIINLINIRTYNC